MDGGIDQGVVDQLVASERTFESVSAFTNAYEGFDVGLADELAVTSEYFQLHVEAQVGETAVNLQSVLYRPPGGDEVTVLRRDFGKLFVSNIAVDTEG